MKKPQKRSALRGRRALSAVSVCGTTPPQILGPGPVFGGYEGNFCNLAN